MNTPTTITAANPLLTRAEAAHVLKICDRSLDAIIRRGRLRVVKIGRNVRIDRTDLDAFIVANKTLPAK